jgi:hypothetical protein
MKKLNLLFFGGLLILYFSSIGFAQAISLQLQNDYTVGIAAQTPRYAVGDVNNDGKPDLVTLNKSNLTANGPISVFLNNGAGGFAAPINILAGPTGLSPNAVAIGDYNKDGFADLAIAQDGIANGINIRLGNGTGNFLTETFIAAERGSPAIASADFNGDGNLDVAICNNNNELRVLNGNGTGSFGAAAVFATAAGSCNDMLTADFNVDGRPDIATATRGSNSLQIFLNNGAGSFNTPVNNLIAGVYQLVAADFNRDCIPDLAATSFSGSTVVILIGNRAGGFASLGTTVTNLPAFMTVGDFNRDKKVDLAIRQNTTTAGANNLTILPGNGNGTFGTAFESSIAVPTSGVEMRLATIDANLDGKADIIIGRQGGFLLYNGNSALFTRTENDFDGDLRTDLSVFRPSNANWYVNRSTQGFMSQQFGLASDKLVTADYDGDGKTDIAIWREGAPSVAAFWILRSSDNTVRIDQFGQTGDDSTVVADWDGDGIADPTVYRSGTTGAQSFFFYRGSLNNPNGNITYLPWGTGGDSPARGDFDGDGKQDAAVFRSSNAVWYVLQSSNGQLRAQNWGLATDKRVSGDYDGDGKTDFAVFRPSNSVWYILNSSNNSLKYYQWGISGDVSTPGDYNGDGTTDTAIYRPSDQRWYVPQCANFNGINTKFGTNGDTAVPTAFVP